MTKTSEPRSDFVRLMARVQAGDADAARTLYEEYGPYIVRAVRRRLAMRLRSQFDSIDFAQDVWASFFATAPDKYDLTHPRQLISLLTAIARHKVIDAVRQRVESEKRNMMKVNPLQSQVYRGAHLPGPQQTPSQILMDREAWNALLADQPPVYRCILLMLRNGKTPETIANELKISIRTVRRVESK